MNKITITSAKLTDIDTLWKWGEENWELWGDAKYKWFSKRSLARWIEEPEDDILLVAKQNNCLVGMCITNVMRDWAFCYGLFVEKAYRKQGIGKLLLEETRKKLKEKGIESLTLLVDTKNTAALKFYKREGFYQGFNFYLMTKEIKHD